MPDVHDMATITKKDLIDRIAETAGCKRVDVKRVVQNFLDEMISELGRGNRLEFRDFGVFEIKERAPRVAQNPKTLQRVPVPAKRTVKFKVGRLLKEQLHVPDRPSDRENAKSPARPEPERPEIVIRPNFAETSRAIGRKTAER
jgi:integration host factor subunit beta